VTSERLKELLEGFATCRLALLGDFFLDRYWVFDPALSETSLETGLEAYQIVGRRESPGAAGTVASNLLSLEVGHLDCIGACGQDGEGFMLQRELKSRGADLRYFTASPHLFTPTYTKPMRLEADGTEREDHRFDLKNRKPLPAAVENTLIEALEAAFEDVQAVIVLDQVQERNCGMITDRVRHRLDELAQAHPDVVVFVDSRERIGEFAHVVIKPNVREASLALYGKPASGDDTSPEAALELAEALFARTQQPVFLTRGATGVLVKTAYDARLVPAVKVEGPIDIVGAGDSFTAGAVLALACGADVFEAAVIGNLVASLTVQQLGTTGTTTRREVEQRFKDNLDLYESF